MTWNSSISHITSRSSGTRNSMATNELVIHLVQSCKISEERAIALLQVRSIYSSPYPGTQTDWR